MSCLNRIAFFTAALTCAIALAHGPQMQITKNEAGKIITRNVFADEPYNTLLTDPKRTYVIPMTSGTALGGGTEFAARPSDHKAPESRSASAGRWTRCS